MIDPNGYFDSMESFLRYYDLAIWEVDHEYFSFESDGFEVMGHVFEPKEYKATVVMVHGFLGHTGLLKNAIQYLTNEGFAVCCFDLPGHGLSTGQRTAIDDFSQYSTVLSDFLDIVKGKIEGPWHFVGHSLGCSITLDYLLSHNEVIFERVVFVAPLIHSWSWKPSKFGIRMFHNVTKEVPRVFRKASHDKQFLKFEKEDPLASRLVSVRWIEAMFAWYDKIETMGGCNRNVKIIQGKNDTVVNWRFNLKFLKTKFSDAETVLIKNGRHELFNESEEIRSEVFRNITDYFGDPGHGCRD